MYAAVSLSLVSMRKLVTNQSSCHLTQVIPCVRVFAEVLCAAPPPCTLLSQRPLLALLQAAMHQVGCCALCRLSAHMTLRWSAAIQKALTC